MNETLANIAVIAATLGTVTFLIPQIVKLWRTGDYAGVSTVWPALGFVTNVGWFSYVISQSLWAAVVAPIFTVLGYAVTLWALSRAGERLGASYRIGAGWAALLVVTVLLAGWPALGLVLAFSYGVMIAPSIWTAYRTADPSGISPGTWWIGLIEVTLWGYFGLFNRDAGIITFAVIGILGSTLMLTRYYFTRQRRAAVARVADPRVRI